MKLSLLPLAFLAAITTVSAGATEIVAELGKISAQTDKVESIVTEFSAGIKGLGDVVPLLIESTELLIDIKKATKVAKASQPFASLDEVIQIVGPTQTLVADVQSLLAALVNAKPKFDKLLIVSPVVLLNLKQQRKATEELNNVVISKVPADFQGLARDLVAPIYVAFDATIAEYSTKR